jgi:hypothetical protein
MTLITKQKLLLKKEVNSGIRNISEYEHLIKLILDAKKKDGYEPLVNYFLSEYDEEAREFILKDVKSREEV